MARKAEKKTSFVYKIPINVLFAAVLFAASITLLHTEKKRLQKNVLGQQTEVKRDQEAVYQWEKIVQEKPGCRDCWLQLSAAYLKLEEKTKAKQALNSAKQIDPNNEHLVSLEKLLTK
jgi:cytochrome c-type biogenesis protein CcmH/NrfG